MHPLPNGKVAARYPPAVYHWRAQVQEAITALGEHQWPFTGAVELRLGFELPRPSSHYGTGRNAGQVRRSAPEFPTVAPDLDKLTRLICDAITDSGLYKDDSQVCQIVTAKRYTSGVPGVLIRVTDLQPRKEDPCYSQSLLEQSPNWDTTEYSENT
jgi:crossover junction endodeoxyribonuclease RusA